VENTLLNKTLNKIKNIAASFHRGAGFMALALCLVASSFALGADPVGHVLLVNGAAERVDAQGARQALADKAAVYEGDTLETTAGALLQIKMIDKALLVLHANSALLIHTYRYNPEDADTNAVRLDLSKGRARSVTGDLGESNHDAFRLNTPIAAIGIRGTDFETNTNDKRTRVRLNSGAIVIAPLGESCPATALGPCKTDNSLLLTDELASPVAELRATDTAPRIIELPDYESDIQGSINEQKEEENISVENQADRIISAITGNKPDQGGEQPGDWVDQIHWGRWEKVQGVEGATVGDHVAENKEILFQNDVFVLFRDGFVSLGQGQASFSLQSYQAGTLEAGQYTPVTLSNGQLAINFDEGKFATSLTATSGAVSGAGLNIATSTGIKGLDLNASGTIDGRGMFRSDQGNMDVFGGLADGGNQAGYLFNHSISDTMSLQGATQWQRR